MVPTPSAETVTGSDLIGQTALYVGDLHESVEESQLFDLFSQIGKVVSVRVCRDASTKRSLGYAYVNYSSPNEASDALQHLNFTSLNGKAFRIMRSNRDSTTRKSGTGNVFIKNLDPSIDNKILYDTFVEYGSILSCCLATNADGTSKGFGFVQFEDERAAENAINQANGIVLNGRDVYVGPFVKKEERNLQNYDNLRFTNLYVKNLTDDISEEDLRNIFGVFGPITSVAVMRDDNGKSKCFGFVNFEHSNDAAKAVEDLNGKRINEKELYVGRAQKKSEREAELRGKHEHVIHERFSNVNLYVKNIDDAIDDVALREVFTSCGSVNSCKILRSSSGKSKGVGFVSFSLPAHAHKALNEIHGKMVGKKVLYVDIAQRKEDKQERLQTRNDVINHTFTPRPGALFLDQQVFYSQPHHSSQPNGFGYRQPGMLHGWRADASNYLIPSVVGPRLHAQRTARRRIGVSSQLQPQFQQLWPVEKHKSGSYSFKQSLSTLGYNEMQKDHTDVVRPSEITWASEPVLAAVSAAAASHQQRVLLGEKLYPLVEKLEPKRSGKVTGMLLEMDEAEIVDLIKSPEALRAKVTEAMDVLRKAHGGVVESDVGFSNQCLNEHQS